MTEIAFTVPWPPSVNNYYVRGEWRRARSGKMYQATGLTKEGQRYRDELPLVLLEQLHGRRVTFHGQVEVELECHPPDKRKRDLDNIEKALFDALQHARILGNDYQIWRKTSERLHVVRGGCVRVTVRPYRLHQTEAA